MRHTYTYILITHKLPRYCPRYVSNTLYMLQSFIPVLLLPLVLSMYFSNSGFYDRENFELKLNNQIYRYAVVCLWKYESCNNHSIGAIKLSPSEKYETRDIFIDFLRLDADFLCVILFFSINNLIFAFRWK